LAVGKTGVACVLRDKFSFKKISSSDHLRCLAQARGLVDTRETLQKLGDLLDEKTGFAWLVDDVAVIQVENAAEQSGWFVDAVRKAQQVEHFRAKFDNVLHVHLTAPEDILRARFLERARDGDETETPASYDICVAHPNEQTSRSLHKIADMVIDLSEVSPTEAAELIVDHQAKAA
jgi:cytidylate kinase